MIEKKQIESWRPTHNWPKDEQVEQDLLLSQAICFISNDLFLSEELVFRGGTAFHKLFLPEPLRYSEDLDFVRTTAGGIGEIMKRITSMGIELGFDVRTKLGKFPKIFWRYQSQNKRKMRIKIEINTYERTPMLPLQRLPFTVDTTYFKGFSNVLTFQEEELIASKMRALYQRRKGRDLFDFWVALTQSSISPEKIIEVFSAYKPEGFTAITFENNIREKILDQEFRDDIDLVLNNKVVDYDIDEAAELVIDTLKDFW